MEKSLLFIKRRFSIIPIVLILLLSIFVFTTSDSVNAECTSHDLEIVSATPPSCTDPGNLDYYVCTNCGMAFLDYDCITETTVEDMTIKALGHSYKTSYSWSDPQECLYKSESDYITLPSSDPFVQKQQPFLIEMGYKHGYFATCNVEEYCSICGEVGGFDYVMCFGEVVTEVTCTSDGIQKFTATFNNTSYVTQEKTMTVSAIGHKMVSTAAKDPTCTEPGTNAYYTCSNCNKVFSDEAGNTETSVEAMKISALQHEYGEPEYVWSQDNTTCTYTRTCTRTGCTHYETETSTATVQIISEPTCTTDGSKKLTAVFENPAFSTREKTVSIDAIGHKMVSTAAKDPTCTEPGTNAYYTCSNCNKIYADSEATTVTTVQAQFISTISHKLDKTLAKEPTCTIPGNKEYWTCSECKGIFSDESGVNKSSIEAMTIKETGHSYGPAVYLWTDNNANCIAVRTCTNGNCVSSETETATSSCVTIDSTCTVEGAMKFTAIFRNAAFVAQEKTVGLALVPHTEEIIPATEATASMEALSEGKKCSVCGKILVPQKSIKVNTDGSTTNIENYTINEESVGNDTVQTVLEKSEDSNKASEVKTVISSSEVNISEKTITKALEQINESLIKYASEGSENKTVTIVSLATEENKTNLKISYAALNAIHDAEAELEISGNLGTLKISQKAAETLLSSGGFIDMSVSYADSSKLTDAQKTKLGDAKLFSLDAYADSTHVTSFAGSISVTLPYELAENKASSDVAVYYLNEDGEFVKVDSSYDATTKSVSFETQHFSYWTVTDYELNPEENNGVIWIVAILICVVVAVFAAFMFKKHSAKADASD